MQVARLHQCLSCNKLVPIIQAKCDCGAPFSGSEQIYKVCPSCGSVIRSTRLRCDCGFLFIFRRFLDKQSVQLITQADLEAARKKGEQDGKLLEVIRSEKELAKLQQEKDAAFQKGATFERRKNDAEWRRFFETAKLKNTITGEPICSREDFYKWAEQYAAAKAERDRRAKEDAEISKKQPAVPAQHIQYEDKESVTYGLIIQYALDLCDLLEPVIPDGITGGAVFICIASFCAWSEIVLGVQRSFVQYVVRDISETNSSADENSALLERLMYASIDTIGYALEGKKEGEIFEVASSTIMKLLKIDPDADVMVKISFLLRDYTFDYAEKRKGAL